MSSTIESRVQNTSLWPSLLVSAILAILLTGVWISYWNSLDHYSWNIFLAPIYIPLAFGLIWPVLIALQTLSAGSVCRISVRQRQISILVFVLSFCCSIFLIRAEYRSLTFLWERARANQLWQAQRQAQELDEQRRAAQLLR